MKIIWLTWKDRSHPLSGGAETVSSEIMSRLAQAGHEIKVITARYPGSKYSDSKNGIIYYRVGNKYTVYSKAKKLYQTKLSGWADVVIDEMNTVPFGSAFYSQTKNVLLCYQLAREVWLYQMAFPLSRIGYFIEPFILRKLSKVYPLTITESNSTKVDLEKYNFKNIQTFRVGMDLKPLEILKPKKRSGIVLSLGAIRPMKRTLLAIKAFEVAKDHDNGLTMIIAGDDSGQYASKIKSYVSKSRHNNAITMLGRVTAKQRLNIMQQADVILVTSIKEGWGLIVTEANSQGTPAIVFDVDGLRDSVQDNITGLLCHNNNYDEMGNQVVKLLSDTTKYNKLRQKAWQWSKEFTFENSYSDFVNIITKNQ